ncbi:hypothetical protein [Candidatus Bodocaedibacter vickermanii]|uniref:Uncharacterized protein n=1 Tax=Candidatus Bodocaedibacter vickermanii TaxID=2741701 RepID=A0A7L9RUN7_9PROT|nr:hypothetical protein CPBP_01132 [Candidatus Paracaedibacteraceae bacterium 'Lake Konstanz']
MKLLKTVLLSTSLLMSVPFAADAPVTAAAVSTARLDEVVATVKAFETYKGKNVEAVLRLLTRDAGFSLETLGLTADSKYVDVLKKLSTVLKDFKTQLADGQTRQAETAGLLATATAANTTLTADKAAAEAALVVANAKLEAVIAEKGVVDGQLAVASARVIELDAALVAETAAAETVGKKDADTIARLRSELAAAQEQVDALTAQAAALSTAEAKAEEAKQLKEKGLRALLAAQAGGTRAAVDEGAADADADNIDDLLEGFDALQTGAEADDDGASPQSLFGEGDLDDISPLRALGATGSPVTAAQIAELKAELATAQAATTASPYKGKGSAKKNTDAQAAAQAEVTRLTAELAALGVN